MSFPKVGQPTRHSRTGRPIMVVLEMLERRWALRILWELRKDPIPFNQLQARCEEISSSVLSRRLGELREAGILEINNEGAYALTKQGQKLGSIILELDKWSKNWARLQG